MKKILVALASLALLAGCMRPLKPGIGGIRLPSGVVGVIQQSENPKTESTQTYTKTTKGNTTTEKVETKIGAAQPDFAREAAAKLSSLRPVVWVGILLFIFGAASAVWPPLKLIVGSVTTSAVCVIAGLALIVLPSLIVGNEMLILCGGVAVAALWWFAHRHGNLRGKLRGLNDN